MKTKTTPKTSKAKKTVKRKTKKTTKKSNLVQSIVKRGQIYCVNHKQNTTPYWGGETCNTHIDHDGHIIRWVCSECVAKMVPAPKQITTAKIDPVTGEKRKRGRPRKHEPKKTLLDENGNPVIRKRGRPKGSVNKVKVTTTTKKTTRKGKK